MNLVTRFSHNIAAVAIEAEKTSGIGPARLAEPRPLFYKQNERPLYRTIGLGQGRQAEQTMQASERTTPTWTAP